MPKILIISLADDPFDPPGAGRYGGSHQFLFDFSRHLVRRYHEVVFVTRKSRPDKPDFQEVGPLCRIYRLDLGLPREVTHHELWDLTRDLCAGARDVARQEADLSAVLSVNWISGLAALATGTRPLVHFILSLGRARLALGEEAQPSDRARDRGELKVFKAADSLICVCHDELMSLRELYPQIDTTKASVIPYGVDSTIFRKRPLPSDVYLHWKAERLEKGS